MDFSFRVGKGGGAQSITDDYWEERNDSVGRRTPSSTTST